MDVALLPVSCFTRGRSQDLFFDDVRFCIQSQGQSTQKWILHDSDYVHRTAALIQSYWQTVSLNHCRWLSNLLFLSLFPEYNMNVSIVGLFFYMCCCTKCAFLKGLPWGQWVSGLWLTPYVSQYTTDNPVHQQQLLMALQYINAAPHHDAVPFSTIWSNMWSDLIRFGTTMQRNDAKQSKEFDYLFTTK